MCVFYMIELYFTYQFIILLFIRQSQTHEKLVKDMVMDQRARPSDRTKTPEEIAQEEKEQLEKLEVCSI
jgi:hypothetical protein